MMVEDIYPIAGYARSISLLARPTTVYTSSGVGLAYPTAGYTRSVSL